MYNQWFLVLICKFCSFLKDVVYMSYKSKCSLVILHFMFGLWCKDIVLFPMKFFFNMEKILVLCAHFQPTTFNSCPSNKNQFNEKPVKITSIQYVAHHLTSHTLCKKITTAWTNNRGHTCNESVTQKVSDLGFGAISITQLTLVITVMSLTHSLTKCQTANFFGNSNDYNRPIDFIESCQWV
jgi:hypothetical protein